MTTTDTATFSLNLLTRSSHSIPTRCVDDDDDDDDDDDHGHLLAGSGRRGGRGNHADQRLSVAAAAPRARALAPSLTSASFDPSSSKTQRSFSSIADGLFPRRRRGRRQGRRRRIFHFVAPPSFFSVTFFCFSERKNSRYVRFRDFAFRSRDFSFFSVDC